MQKVYLVECNDKMEFITFSKELANKWYKKYMETDPQQCAVYVTTVDQMSNIAFELLEPVQPEYDTIYATKNKDGRIIYVSTEKQLACEHADAQSGNYVCRVQVYHLETTDIVYESK
jgi:hypothetical protein